MRLKQPVSFSRNPSVLIPIKGKQNMLRKLIFSFVTLLAFFSLNTAVLAADSDPDTLRVALLPDCLLYTSDAADE